MSAILRIFFIFFKLKSIPLRLMRLRCESFHSFIHFGTGDFVTKKSEAMHMLYVLCVMYVRVGVFFSKISFSRGETNRHFVILNPRVHSCELTSTGL